MKVITLDIEKEFGKLEPLGTDLSEEEKNKWVKIVTSGIYPMVIRYNSNDEIFTEKCNYLGDFKTVDEHELHYAIGYMMYAMPSDGYETLNVPGYEVIGLEQTGEHEWKLIKYEY